MFDWTLRCHLIGTNLSQFIIKRCPVLRPSQLSALASIAARLSYSDKLFAEEILAQEGMTRLALTPHERLRLRLISEAVIAALYGLDEADYRQIMAECDYPCAMLSQKDIRASLNQKGFWRIDKEREPWLRQSVLALIAFLDLRACIDAHSGDTAAGIDAFLALNDGEGWMLPEQLCLADYGLGHGDAACVEAHAVASEFGPHFYAWQCAQSAEEFRRECAIHAQNLAFGRSECASSMQVSTQSAAAPPADSATPVQLELEI